MEKVDGLPLAELRLRSSAKWRDFPSEVLPLPVAEMDFEITPASPDTPRSKAEGAGTGARSSTSSTAVDSSPHAAV